MTKAVLSVGAFASVAVALVGCAGGRGASGTTGSAVGRRDAQGAKEFRASIHRLEARLQTRVRAYERGNPSGGSILSDCTGFVDAKIAPLASTQSEEQALGLLRTACGEMRQAAYANASKRYSANAKQFARDAVAQVRIALRLAG